MADPQAARDADWPVHSRRRPAEPSEKSGDSDNGRRADCPFYRGTHAAVGRSNQWIRADRKSTRLNSSHQIISYAVFCLKKKKQRRKQTTIHIRSHDIRGTNPASDNA